MQKKKNHYAIIDIGSNTMRLVVYRQQNSLRLHEVENVKSVARLRNYLDKYDNLSEAGITKLMQTLSSFQKVVETYNLTKFVCVATATIRQAKNKKEIKNRIREELGWDLRILSENEEAYYGYLAVVNSTRIKEGITVDIGGGSTEVTYFKDRKLIKSHSFPFGALTLKQFFTNQKPTGKEISKLHTFLKKEFQSLGWIHKQAVPLIAIGGSARNLVQVHQSQIDYPLAGLHQYQMSEKEMEKICKYFAGFSEKELEKLDGLSKDRADIIFPASLVFLTLFQTIRADSFILSRKGLRDGVFYEYLAQDSHANLYPNVLEDSVHELIHEYRLKASQIKHILPFSEKLFQQLLQQNIGELDEADWLKLERGCYVYNLGNYIDSESSSQHTFYLLANRTIDGLMHMERLEMALLASYKNKSTFDQYLKAFHKNFSKNEADKLATLGALLKFIYCFDATRRQIVQGFHLDIEKKDLYFKIYCNQDFMPEQYQAEKQKKHLEKAISRNIHLEFLYTEGASLLN